MKRVVVTGAGVVTSLGHDWETFAANLKDGVSGIKVMPEWDRYEDLNTRLGGPVSDFKPPAHYSRKKTRTMGRVSLMGTYAAEKALQDAGLLGDPVLQSGRVGVAYGSSTGSTDAVTDFGSMLVNGDMSGITATTYIRMMGHTTAVNIGMFFGLRGRIIATSTACTSGSQGIGAAYEAIRYGRQTIMLAGGAEELCPTEAAVFDTLYATSTRNDEPQLTPRPFDRDRDGLVIGEGAGTLVLEELDHARARGAAILAEVVGYGTNSDGGHVTQPSSGTMRIAMELALADAGIDAAQIVHVNAHGTATEQGDRAESTATAALFGCRTPFSSLKGHLGHTLGACGVVEAWASIQMMNSGWFAPTLNLENPDPRCGELDYIMGEGRYVQGEYVMNNNFAFGGINTSLIFKRWPA
ncbi:MAG TPA: beta-ketoacyl-ACP synthase [Gammaproteobacteria bacterium]|nr:beta-ketoacyl-ACP synthase [Gammaproteobacteria bacterium]